MLTKLQDGNILVNRLLTSSRAVVVTPCMRFCFVAHMKGS